MSYQYNKNEKEEKNKEQLRKEERRKKLLVMAIAKERVCIQLLHRGHSTFKGVEYLYNEDVEQKRFCGPVYECTVCQRQCCRECFVSGEKELRAKEYFDDYYSDCEDDCKDDYKDDPLRMCRGCYTECVETDEEKKVDEIRVCDNWYHKTENNPTYIYFGPAYKCQGWCGHCDRSLCRDCIINISMPPEKYDRYLCFNCDSERSLHP